MVGTNDDDDDDDYDVGVGDCPYDGRSDIAQKSRCCCCHYLSLNVPLFSLKKYKVDAERNENNSHIDTTNKKQPQQQHKKRERGEMSPKQ